MIKPKKDIEIGKNKFFMINDGKKHQEHLDDIQPSESERQNTDENRTLSNNNDQSRNNADAPFIMTIEVEEGRNDKIYIYFDSSAEELAFDFCKKNNLDFNSLKYLTEEIGKLIEKLHEKKNAETIHEVDEESKLSEVNRSITTKENKNANIEIPINNSISNKFQNEDTKNTNINNNSNYLKESNILFDKNKKEIQNNIINTNNSLATSNRSKEINSAKSDNKEENTNKETLNNSIKDVMFNKVTKTEENEVNFLSNPEYLITNQIYENTAPNTSNNKIYEYQLYLKQIINKEARKKLSRNSNNSKDNIFNKLYNDSKYRKTKKLSMTDDISTLTLPNKTVNNTRAKSPNVNLIINNNNNIFNTVNKFSSPTISKNINPGERLYYKGVVSKEEKIRKNSQKMAEHQKRCNFPFQPNIDKNKKERKSENNLKSSDINHKRYISLLSNKNSKHLLSRNFSPSQVRKEEGYLNQFLTESSMKKKDCNMELNDLSKSKKRENCNLMNSCNSPDLYKSINVGQKTPFSTEDYIERQQEFDRKKSEKYMKLKEQYHKPSEKISNQKLVSSQIHKLKNQSTTNKDLYETLLNEFKLKRLLNERQENLGNYQKKTSNTCSTTNANDLLYNKKKIEQFEKIFKLLDQDEDGLISSLNITIKNIPQQLVRIINPIIQLLKEDNIRLNCIEFIKECEYLFENLTYLEKKDLLNFDKFYDQSLGFSGNNTNFIKKILYKKDNSQMNNLSRQKTNSTISVDKSFNPLHHQNNLNTASNEDLLNLYNNIKY